MDIEFTTEVAEAILGQLLVASRLHQYLEYNRDITFEEFVINAISAALDRESSLSVDTFSINGHQLLVSDSACYWNGERLC